MVKRLLIFSFASLLMFTAPAYVSAAEMELAAAEEQVEEQILVSVEKQTVCVTGAQGSTLEVVSLTGRRVMSVKIDSPAQRIELNVPKGCYILKVGKVVRKIQVR